MSIEVAGPGDREANVANAADCGDATDGIVEQSGYNDRAQMRRIRGGDAESGQARPRVAIYANLAIRPGLLHDPVLNDFVAILNAALAHVGEFAFRRPGPPQGCVNSDIEPREGLVRWWLGLPRIPAHLQYGWPLLRFIVRVESFRVAQHEGNSYAVRHRGIRELYEVAFLILLNFREDCWHDNNE